MYDPLPLGPKSGICHDFSSSWPSKSGDGFQWHLELLQLCLASVDSGWTRRAGCWKHGDTFAICPEWWLGNNYPDLSSIFIFDLFRIPDLVVETFRCFNVSFVPFPMFWKKKTTIFPWWKSFFPVQNGLRPCLWRGLRSSLRTEVDHGALKADETMVFNGDIMRMHHLIQRF